MTRPITLAIDTARERLQLALAGRAGDPATHIHDIARGHAEIIMDAIGALLAENELDYERLERIAVTTGPGSFTGLRIGLSVARALGLAKSLPVIGVPSLLALSLGQDGPRTILVDARRGQAYLQRFSAPGVSAGPARLVDFEAALSEADTSAPDDPIVDISRVASWAQRVDPAQFPPLPVYIRDADAKPQTRGRVARA